jgi:NAD(P)-dependent dehydrogenase (short-subunit alcohol dehydrogenase family)
MARSVRRADRVDLSGRTAVVTGASQGGIGFATAELLAAWGADVVITTRADPAATVALLGAGVRGHRLDLTDADSVETFAAWCDRPVDVLVNNAGVHLDLRTDWDEPKLTADGFEIHWRTNYLGTAHLTHQLLPQLRAAEHARVVNVVSKLHARADNRHLFAAVEPYHSWVAYGASKLALIHHAFELNRRYAPVGVSGYALHPGAVYTRIADKGLAGHRVLNTMRHALAPVERRVLLSADDGAQTPMHCATAADAPGGRYYVNCAVAEPSEAATDPAVGQRLWERTEEWINELAQTST